MNTVIIGDNQSINKCYGELINELHAFRCTYFQPSEAFDRIGIAKVFGIDLILIDLSSSIKNSCEFIEKLHTMLPKVPLIALHFYKDRELIDEIIQAGASAYLLINTKPAELKKAIRSIGQGKIYITEEIN